MSDRDGESALGRADGFFKKVLERVGATVDDKIAAGDAARLPPSAVGSMASAIERAVEDNMRADTRGVRRIAPDRFAVLLTYEQNARLSDAHRAALARELAASAYEYVVNHRYTTLNPVYVEVGCDIFVTKTEVRATFSPAPGKTGEGVVREVRPVAAGEVRAPDAPDIDFQFVGAGGKPVVRVHLAPGGEPVTVGRATGNRICIDHDSVSKFHATVGMSQDGRLVVADLGSTNGTFVGGEKKPIATARDVEPGDTIVFGDIPFRVEKV